MPLPPATIPGELLEATLFGDARGAFTSPPEMPGAWELARGGTLFLDEISHSKISSRR